MTPSTTQSASCARCGAPLPITRSGTPKSTARYCCILCRVTATKERRARARNELVPALERLQEALADVGRHLKTLGLPSTWGLPEEDCGGSSTAPGKELP